VLKFDTVLSTAGEHTGVMCRQLVMSEMQLTRCGGIMETKQQQQQQQLSAPAGIRLLHGANISAVYTT